MKVSDLSQRQAEEALMKADVRATRFVADLVTSPFGKPPCPAWVGWRGRQPYP